MSLEDLLSGWTGPSSATEQDKQDRTERMVREAVRDHGPFADCSLNVYAKGSYANNTNVKADSDVDIGVQCQDVMYWEEETPGAHTGGTPYAGLWTPAKLRSELKAALIAKFGTGDVDDSGATAFTVRSSSARVDADVVPCFDYRYYFSGGGSRDGARIFPKTGLGFENYPDQQLSNGNAKNNRSGTIYKKGVRVMKRVENAMVENNAHREVPSFFIECLVYNCPDSIFARSSWTDRVSAMLVHIWEDLQGDAEPDEESDRWLEVNECKYLFHARQKWSRADGRDFAKAAWNYLGYAK
jgi:hypothetical protein